MTWSADTVTDKDMSKFLPLIEQSEFRLFHSFCFNSQKSGFISTRLEKKGNIQICTDLIIILYSNLATIQIRNSSHETRSKNKLMDFWLHNNGEPGRNTVIKQTFCREQLWCSWTEVPGETRPQASCEGKGRLTDSSSANLNIHHQVQSSVSDRLWNSMLRIISNARNDGIMDS